MSFPRWISLALALPATACSTDRAPLAPLAGTLEVRVLDAPVVARLDGNGYLSFDVRLEVRNASPDLPLRWGGCGGLALRAGGGAFLWSPQCAAIALPHDDRPVLAPGESRIVVESFHVGREWTRWPDARIEGEFRLTAYFGVDRVESLERLLGRQSGQSESNAFVLALDDPDPSDG